MPALSPWPWHLEGCKGEFGSLPRSRWPVPGPPQGPHSSPPAGGRYIEVFREKNVTTAKGPPKNSAKPWQGRTLGENEEEEDLADSGRLFIRNLPYTSTEEDLEQLFSKFGRGAASSCPHTTPIARNVRAAGLGSSTARLPSAPDHRQTACPSDLCSVIRRWG